MHSKVSCRIGSRGTACLVHKPCPARLAPCLTSRPHRSTVLQAAAQAEEAAAASEPQQQLETDQQQKPPKQKERVPGQLLRTRIKRRAAEWKDKSTPNTGLVGITQKSRAESAAACVVADLKTAVSTYDTVLACSTIVHSCCTCYSCPVARKHQRHIAYEGHRKSDANTCSPKPPIHDPGVASMSLLSCSWLLGGLARVSCAGVDRYVFHVCSRSPAL
jgi:hypothetical protein